MKYCILLYKHECDNVCCDHTATCRHDPTNLWIWPQTMLLFIDDINMPMCFGGQFRLVLRDGIVYGINWSPIWDGLMLSETACNSTVVYHCKTACVKWESHWEVSKHFLLPRLLSTQSTDLLTCLNFGCALTAAGRWPLPKVGKVWRTTTDWTFETGLLVAVKHGRTAWNWQFQMWFIHLFTMCRSQVLDYKGFYDRKKLFWKAPVMERSPKFEFIVFYSQIESCNIL